MRLPRPFYRLPVRFDAERLAAELAALPADAWMPHPNEIPGNSSVRLISAGGGENDDVAGRMLATPRLRAMPYVRQVLASFGVVWSRSRLMRLAPGASVPPHADINHHWFSRVRVHIPIATHPDVSFHCGDERVHMAAGEAWVFDNWRLHRVDNPSPVWRVHLVADTSGTAPFWRLVAQDGAPVHQHRFDPVADPPVMTESNPAAGLMPAPEVELLLADLRGELASTGTADAANRQLARYCLLLEEFCRDWCQLLALHGTDDASHPDFATARDRLRNRSRELGDGLVMRTNGVAAHQVLEGRLLRHLLPAAVAAPPKPALRTTKTPPVFIVAAPRSGSTLLFETLATHAGIATLGGEAHWLVEGMPALRPGGPLTDSNRLTAAAATAEVRGHITAAIRERLLDSAGRPAGEGDLTFLEKTPKNALRIPFLHALFPEARFILLWRDPRENLASIIEAWRSGQFVTYPALPGRTEPWSLLLPPQWQWMNGRPVEELAAWQWDSTNRCILDDLATLPRAQWAVADYTGLCHAPRETVSRLCEFLGLPVDEALAARLAAPLPPSRYTRTPPAPDKWRAHEALIGRVLPLVEATHQRLLSLG